MKSMGILILLDKPFIYSFNPCLGFLLKKNIGKNPKFKIINPDIKIILA